MAALSVQHNVRKQLRLLDEIDATVRKYSCMNPTRYDEVFLVGV